MAQRWPSFVVTAREGQRVVWEGTLDPVQRRYRLRIDYEAPYAVEVFTVLHIQPRVQVLSPVLERHPEFEEGPIPHVYFNRNAPTLPFLCLFDPYRGEWSPEDLIAETTVPWAARYLYFYEGWLTTGKWLGGGRHPTALEREGLRDGKTLTTA